METTIAKLRRTRVVQLWLPMFDDLRGLYRRGRGLPRRPTLRGPADDRRTTAPEPHEGSRPGETGPASE